MTDQNTNDIYNLPAEENGILSRIGGFAGSMISGASNILGGIFDGSAPVQMSRTEIEHMSGESAHGEIDTPWDNRKVATALDPFHIAGTAIGSVMGMFRSEETEGPDGIPRTPTVPTDPNQRQL